MMSTTTEPAPGSPTSSKRTLELYIQSVEDYAIFILDPQGNVASWNAGAEKIKGYRADEIIGRHFSIFYSNEDLELGKPEVELESARREGRLEDEGWRLRKDGALFWANVVITAVHDVDGTLVGFTKVTRDLTERIKQAELERTRAAAAQAHIAREDEQRRIARELHDDLGQQLIALKMDVGIFRASPPGSSGHDDSAARFDRLETRIDAIIASIRRIAADLRPPLLDDLGLAAAIEWIANDIEQRHAFSVVPNIDIGELEFNGPAASSLFRVVQEALNNIVRHSRATHADIRLHTEGDTLRLRIDDNGVGVALSMPRNPASFGLVGMGERIHMLGGKIAIHSEPGAGFSIDVTIPIENVRAGPGRPSPP